MAAEIPPPEPQPPAAAVVAAAAVVVAAAAAAEVLPDAAVRVGSSTEPGRDCRVSEYNISRQDSTVFPVDA